MSPISIAPRRNLLSFPRMSFPTAPFCGKTAEIATKSRQYSHKISCLPKFQACTKDRLFQKRTMSIIKPEAEESTHHLRDSDPEDPDDEVAKVQEMLHTDTKRINRARWALTLALILLAVAVCATTFVFLKDEEDHDFRKAVRFCCTGCRDC